MRASPALAQVLPSPTTCLYDLKLHDRAGTEYTGRANRSFAPTPPSSREAGPRFFSDALIPGHQMMETRNVAETAAFLRSLGDPRPGCN